MRAAYGLDRKDQGCIDMSNGTLLRYGCFEEMKSCLEKHRSVVAAVIMECIRNELPSVSFKILQLQV